jgi:hypothetical protein
VQSTQSLKIFLKRIKIRILFSWGQCGLCMALWERKIRGGLGRDFEGIQRVVILSIIALF